MNWIPLTDEKMLADITERSQTQPQLIFKHSTRCSISSMSLARLERSRQPEGIDFYLLDLLQYRNISNKIAADFEVYHQSPQVLLIKNGSCVYEESHSAIDMEEIAAQAQLAV